MLPKLFVLSSIPFLVLLRFSCLAREPSHSITVEGPLIESLNLQEQIGQIPQGIYPIVFLLMSSLLSGSFIVCFFLFIRLRIPKLWHLFQRFFCRTRQNQLIIIVLNTA